MLKAIIGAVCAIVLLPASAEAVVGCTGQVRQIELRSNGLLIADWGYGYKGLCYLNQDVNVNGVTTIKDACSSYYAAILTSSANHQQIMSFHNTNDCQTAMAETSGAEHWMAVPPYSVILVTN